MSERLQISRTLSLEPSLAFHMCLNIFQLFSELGSLTCDSDCALKTRATSTLSHTPSDSVDLCRDRLVHGPPLLPPASPFKQNLFEERPILATPTPGFRGYVQPLHVQHPSSSPLGGNEKLSFSTKSGAVKLSDRPRGGLHTWLVRRLCLWTATTRYHSCFLGCENTTKTVFLTLSCLLRGYK